MSRTRAALVLLGAGGLGLLGLAARAPAPPVEQPIAFNHRAHAEAEIGCDYCHFAAAAFDGAGMPKVSSCADCHAGIDSEGKESAKLFAYAERSEEPAWQALFVVPPYTRFSHAPHVAAEVACETCHGDIGRSERPPAVRTHYEMDGCVKCHAEKRASTDCLTCHK